MDDQNLDSLGDWQLVSIMKLDELEPIQCECRTCGRKVWKTVYMIEWPGGRLECWGEGCYKRELGCTSRGQGMTPTFPEFSGARLTAEERVWLTKNRSALKTSYLQRREAVRLAEQERADREQARTNEIATALREKKQFRPPPVQPQPRQVLPAEPFRAQAHLAVFAKWKQEELLPVPPGLVGMFNKEVEEEYQRLLKGFETK